MWRMDEGQERLGDAPRVNPGRGIAYWSDGRASDARGRVERAVDVERRRLALCARVRPEVARRPAPRDLERLRVLRVDLIE